MGYWISNRAQTLVVTFQVDPNPVPRFNKAFLVSEESILPRYNANYRKTITTNLSSDITDDTIEIIANYCDSADISNLFLLFAESIVLFNDSLHTYYCCWDGENALVTENYNGSDVYMSTIKLRKLQLFS